MRLDADKVKKALESSGGGDYLWESFRWYINQNNDEVTIDGETYPVELIEEYTGEEGDYSAETFVIVKVGEQTFRKTGHYRSHYGNDWDGPFTEVQPVEKKVTAWEPRPAARPVSTSSIDSAVDYWGEVHWGDVDTLTIDGVDYPLEVVESHGGGEGDGSEVWVVFKVDGRLFRKSGYYASHYGTDWDGSLEEVEAFEKTVTDYRTI